MNCLEINKQLVDCRVSCCNEYDFSDGESNSQQCILRYFKSCWVWLSARGVLAERSGEIFHRAQAHVVHLHSRVEIHWLEQVVEARLQKPLAQIQEGKTKKRIR